MPGPGKARFACSKVACNVPLPIANLVKILGCGLWAHPLLRPLALMNALDIHCIIYVCQDTVAPGFTWTMQGRLQGGQSGGAAAEPGLGAQMHVRLMSAPAAEPRSTASPRSSLCPPGLHSLSASALMVNMLQL